MIGNSGVVDQTSELFQ